MSINPVRLDGGGCCQLHLLWPDKSKLLALADTQGAYLSASARLGDHWTVQNTGIGASGFYRQFAAGAMSITETSPQVVYGGVGEHGASGGMLAGTYSATTGNITWALRSNVPQFAGNQLGNEFPANYSNGWQRAKGRLMLAGASNFFAGTYKQGVLRSSNTGTDGTHTGVGYDGFPVACQMGGAAPGTGTWFCKSICFDPNTATTIWAAFYQGTPGVNGSAAPTAGLWKCNNANAGTPNFVQVTGTGAPTVVEDIFAVGDYLYCACGNLGIYRYGPLSGTPAWTALNGASNVPTTPSDPTGNWWTTISGWIDGGGTHQIVAGDSNPAQGAGLAKTLMQLAVSATAGSTPSSFTSLTGSVQVTNVPTPTGSYPWWMPAQGVHAYLGGAGYICPFVTIDATNPAAPNIYAAGSGGCYRSLAGGGWTVANSGMPMFLGHPIFVNPVHAGHAGWGDSDWGAFDDIGPGVEDATTLTHDVPSFGGPQGWSLACSTDGSTVYCGTGDKYHDSSGDISSRPWNQPSNWTSLGFAGAAGGHVAIGLAAFTDDTGVPAGTGPKILLASGWGSGMWRYAPDPVTSVYKWTKVNTTIATSGGAGNQCPITYGGGGLVFVFDRKNGIYRSNDWGKTWVLIWNKTTNDSLSGTVAYDPTRPGRLWVSATGKLYKLSGADTGTVTGGGITGSGSPVVPGVGSGVAGPVAMTPEGELIYATQDTGNGTGLWRTADDGTTYADIVGDGTFARGNCNPEFIGIGAKETGIRRIWVSGSNVVVTGLPSTGGGGQPASAPFTERQASANLSTPGGSGVLTLWFSEASGGPGPGGLGAPSLAGSMLSARLELLDVNATVTPPNPNWILRVDKVSQVSTGTARVQIWDFLNNPGGLGGPVNAPLTLPAGLTRPAPPATPRHGLGVMAAGGPLGRPHAPPAPGGPPVVLAGIQSPPGSTAGQPVPGSIVFTSSSTQTVKGKLFEYTTPAGTIQVFDQSGSSGAEASTTSEGPTTCAAANTMTGGLGVLVSAEHLSTTGASGAHTTPAGWTSDGSANNTTLNFSTYYNAALTAGPTTVTETVAAGTGAVMAGWAAALATYYAIATSQPSFTTLTLPKGTSGAAYSQQINATGGATPYVFTVTGGSLPPGLGLSSAGLLSGTPTGGGGSYPFTVTLTDAAGQVVTQTYTVVIAPPLAVSTGSLPGTATGVIYSQTLAATGGTSPYSWSVTAGSLPPGISLTSTGIVTGTAALAGTYAFTVTVLDQHGLTATAALSIVVTTGALAVATQVLSYATLGQTYTAVLAASGGTPPYTWSLTGGSLPPGLAFDAGGNITGTPTSQGASTFTVEVTDNVGAHAFASFTITVFLLIPVIAPAGPWRVMTAAPQPAGGITGMITQAQSRVVTLRTEPDQQDQVDINIDGTSAPALRITELLTDIVVLFGDKPVFVGRIGPGQDDLDAGAHRLAVTAMDYRSILGRRKLIASDTLSYTNIDQAVIAWNLLQLTQNRPGGQLGIVRGVGQTTGITRTYTATAGDMVGDDITALAQLNGGFEWSIDSKNAQFTDLRLNIWYPSQGADNGVVLMYGDGRVSSISRSVDPSAYANSVMVTGNSSKTLTTQNLDAADIATNQAGRFDTVIGTNDNTQSTLNDDAAGQLAAVQVLIPTYTVQLYPGAWADAGGPDWLWKGDQVTVVIDSGRLAVVDKLRVVEMSFDIGNDNVETLTLTIGRIPFRLNQKIPAILRRLRYLETR